MENFSKDYLSDEIKSAEEKVKLLEIRKKEFKILKKKLEKEFNFEIVGYIIDDILDCETFHHICLMINMAIINNRLSIENGKYLKEKIKSLYNIKNINDRIFWNF